MKNLCLALIALLLASAARAADDTTAKPQTPAQQQQTQSPKPAAPAAAPENPPTKETPNEQQVKQEAPRETPATAPAKAEAGAPAQPAKKEEARKSEPQTACAQALVPLGEVYRDAYIEMRKFIDDVDVQTKAADERVAKLEKQIQDDESAMTKAKLDGDGAKEEELSHQDKQLWKDLKAAKKERASLCSGFARDAKQKVRDFAGAAEAKLGDCQQRMQQ